MRTKTHWRAFALAGVLRRGRPAGTFTSGLLYGLSAASLLLGGRVPVPRTPFGSIDADWQAVGSDLARAFDQYER